MNRLRELTSRLSPAQVREVEDFAEFLSKRYQNSTGALAEVSIQDKKQISFEGWEGCMAHIDRDKSDKQLIREAWDDVLKKFDR